MVTEGLMVIVTSAELLVTVTVQLLEVMFDPSVDLAVTVTDPALMPVTTPPLTVAVVVSFEVQVRVLFVALAGNTVAVSVVVAPALTDAVDGIVMLVTSTLAAFTVKLRETGVAAA